MARGARRMTTSAVSARRAGVTGLYFIFRASVLDTPDKKNPSVAVDGSRRQAVREAGWATGLGAFNPLSASPVARPSRIQGSKSIYIPFADSIQRRPHEPGELLHEVGCVPSEMAGLPEAERASDKGLLLDGACIFRGRVVRQRSARTFSATRSRKIDTPSSACDARSAALGLPTVRRLPAAGDSVTSRRSPPSSGRRRRGARRG
jgi:hypothetical protein